MRADERGAALFVVVLIVVLLTAIGAFAAHATAFTQTAAGYSRRASSAFYIGEFATNYVLSELVGKEYHYVQQSYAGRNNCRATEGVVAPSGAAVPCYAFVPTEMAKFLDSTITGDPDGAVFGALSRPDRPAEQAIRATYVVEMTDIVDAGEAQQGMGTDTTRVWRAALTTTAQLLPFTSGTACNEDESRASENLSFRGFVVFTTQGTPPGAPPP